MGMEISVERESGEPEEDKAVGGIALSANPPRYLGGYLARASGRFSAFLGTAHRD
jgi:hypothetical protein